MTSLAAPRPILHAALIDALGCADPEPAFEQAFHQLSKAGSLPLLLATVKGLAHAGLAGLAVRLLQSSTTLSTALPQLDVLTANLERLPSGELAATDLARRFEANRAALLNAGNSFVNGLTGDYRPLRAFQSHKGNVHAVLDDSRNFLGFVFPFVDQAAQAQAISLPIESLSASYLLIGVPSVPLWKRLLSVRTAGGYRPPITILEPNERVFKLWLHLIDTHDAFVDQRVCIIVGDDWKEQFIMRACSERSRLPPSICLTNHRPGWNPPQFGPDIREQLNVRVRDQQEHARRQLDAMYRMRAPSYWRNRFRDAAQSGPPLRIVGFTNRYSTVIQHVMRDVSRAFQRRGCEFEIITQVDDCSAIVDVHSAMTSAPRDLVFVIDHLRFEYAGLIPLHVPFVGWIQDYMESLWTKQAGQSVGELDLVIGHSPHVMSSLYDYPIDRFLPSSNLTAIDTYHNSKATQRELEPYICDVSYVSHGSESPLQLAEDLARGSGSPFKEYMIGALKLIERRLAAGGAMTSFELLEVMLEAERISGHPPLAPDVRRARVFPQIARLYDRVFRHQAIAWVSRWAQTRNRTFKLFGRGWERQAEFAPFACGEIASGEPLRKLYQASAVSLQVNGYSSLHQRLLDGLASGGFMLSRWNPADSQRRAFQRLQSLIAQHGIRDLAELVEARRVHPSVDVACCDVEALTGLAVALLEHPNRKRHVQVSIAANPVVDQLTDEGLFRVFQELRLVPSRAAADLPGFDQTVFRNETELHGLLDKFVADAEKRKQVGNTMRESVVRHDTYDVLVDRILTHFSSLRISP